MSEVIVTDWPGGETLREVPRVDEPRTEAGKSLIDDWDWPTRDDLRRAREAILAIEAEALSAYRARLRERVSSMTFHPHRSQEGGMDTFIDRTAVLALIDEEDPT